MKATVAKVNVNACNWVTAKCHARVILLRGTGGTALVLTGHEAEHGCVRLLFRALIVRLKSLRLAFKIGYVVLPTTIE